MKKTVVLMFGNNKGGVSKTTSSINTTAALIEKGKSVVYVDMDESMNSTFHLKAAGSKERAFPVTRLLSDPQVDISECILFKTRMPGSELGIIQAEKGIKDQISQLTGGDENKLRAVGERLRNHLEKLDGEVDYIIIDVGPSLDSAIAVAMMSVTHLILVADASAYAEEGIANLLNSGMRLTDKGASGVKIMGALYSNLDMRTGIAKTLLDRQTICADLAIPVLPVYIPHRTEIVDNSYSKEFAVRPGKSTIIGDAYRDLADYIIQNAVFEQELDQAGAA